MSATDYSTAVWGSAGVVLLGLVIIAWLLSRMAGSRRAVFWSGLGLALALSGPAVRALVQLWTAAPSLRVVPGMVATWTPAILALGASLLLLRRQRPAGKLRSDAPPGVRT